MLWCRPLAQAKLTEYVERARACLQLQIELEPFAYRVACDAHRDGRRVQVRGTIERFGRRWRIVDIRNFSMLEGEPLPPNVAE